MNQYSADLVDWDWLSSFGDARARIEALLDGEREDKILSCSALLPDWSDRADPYIDTSDSLDILLEQWAEESPERAEHLRDSLSLLLTNEHDYPDELDLATESEGCFFASLSPGRVRRARQALARLELADVVKAFFCEEELDPQTGEIAGQWRASFEDDLAYLEQWAALLVLADERGMGIVAHAG